MHLAHVYMSIHQKSPIYTSEEPYIYAKRALYTRQKIPTCMHLTHVYTRIRQKSPI